MTFLHRNVVEMLILNGNTYIMHQKGSQHILHAFHSPESVKTVESRSAYIFLTGFDQKDVCQILL